MMSKTGICAAIIVITFGCGKYDRLDTEAIMNGHYSEIEYGQLSSVLDLPRSLDSYQGFQTESSDAIATLGRVLFYDKDLSLDGTISCASCHIQSNAFSDVTPLSGGILGQKTERNSLALGIFEDFTELYGSGGERGEAALFWDTRTDNVHSQIVETFANEKEMGMSMSDVLDRLSHKRHYEILYDKAFNTTLIKEKQVLIAIERFMEGMTASDSKFTRFKRELVGGIDGIENREFSSQEKKGFGLFKLHCQSCHASSIGLQFLEPGKHFANNGLDLETTDPGRKIVTNQDIDEAVFKVPSLFNIALTSPYMHDGRFDDLESVLDFYSNEIQNHPNLDPLLKDEFGDAKKFNFTPEEKSELLSFLHTLTDMSELSHMKFSDPWK